MAGGDDLKLLGWWASPPVLRVRLALSIKGVSYEYLEQDLQNKSELLLKTNPVHEKVPVLIHGGKPICESSVIIQYIDEVFSGADPLLPVDPYERTIARFWVAFIDDKLPHERVQESRDVAMVHQRLRLLVRRYSATRGGIMPTAAISAHV